MNILSEQDKRIFTEIVRGKGRYEDFNEDEIRKLIEIARRNRIFIFECEDYVEFLEKMFEEEFRQVLEETGLKKDDKPEIALILSQRLPPKKVQKIPEFKELKKFIEHNFKIDKFVNSF